jgi:tRNA pseudouridine38-40 synthase
VNERPNSGRKLENWKITVAYDGTDYRGWQIQPDAPTIQGELQAALGRICGESPLPQGSGRTDAGVHALAQVASFELQAPIPPENLLLALNRTLPAAIRVLEARHAPPGFHARHSAIAKTYEYRMFLERDLDTGDSLGHSFARQASPFLARYVYSCPWAMDFEALQRAAAHFVGCHDFTSFMATDPDLATRIADEDGNPAPPVRTIYSSDWEKRAGEDGASAVYRVRGNGFLHHMVRNLVGTMVDVGRGSLDADKIPEILAARSRAAAGPTAPARGLFLHSVEYGGAERRGV